MHMYMYVHYVCEENIYLNYSKIFGDWVGINVAITAKVCHSSNHVPNFCGIEIKPPIHKPPQNIPAILYIA